jgi:hypothetical protein
MDIFALPIGQKAGELEAAADNSDFDFIESNNKIFIESASKLVAEIDGMISAKDAENPRLKKSEPDRELLKQMVDACNEYDTNKVEEIMDELELFSYEKDNEFIEWLRENVVMMAYAKIAERISGQD